MSVFTAEKSETAYTCSKTIHDFLVKENITDANLFEKIKEIEDIQREFANLDVRLQQPFLTHGQETSFMYGVKSRKVESPSPEDTDVFLQKMLKERVEILTEKERLAAYKEAYMERKKQTMPPHQQTREQQMQQQQEMREYSENNQRYNALTIKLNGIDARIRHIQTSFQSLLKLKKRRVEIMETYPTNEFGELLLYLRSKYISKMSSQWSELVKREKLIQDEIDNNKVQQLENLKNKQKEIATKKKEMEIKQLQKQLEELQNGV
jgi:hypothetical protein